MITEPIRVNYGESQKYYYFDNDKKNAQHLGTGAGNKENTHATQQEFQSLCAGTGFAKNAGKPDRLAGMDFTFSMAKSASVLSLYDTRIETAFEESIAETLKIAENRYTYVNSNGTMQKSDNLHCIEFKHYSNRNAEIQQHRHVFILNKTNYNNKIHALEFKELYSNKAYLGALQENIFAQKLKNLGYDLDINHNKAMSDIKLSDNSIKDLLSTRTAEIQRKAQELKIKYPTMSDKEILQIANKETRRTKEKNYSKKEIIEKTEKTLNKEQLQSLKNDIKNAKLNNNININNVNNNNIHEAIQDLESQKRFFSYEMLENTMIKKNFGHINENDIKNQIENSKDLIKLNDKYFTSESNLKIAQKNIDIIKNNKETAQIFTSGETEKAIKNYELNKNRVLTDGQKSIVNQFVNRQKFAIIQGDAGTGKTTSFTIVNELAKSKNEQIVGIAATAKAAQELKSAGISEIYTIAALQNMKKENLDSITQDKILIIDEASMVSDKQANFLLNIDNSKKIVISGDVKQFSSIESGNFLEDMQNNIDKNNFVNLSEAKRFQTQSQVDITSAFSSKNYEEAAIALQKHNAVIDVADENDKINKISEKYIENRKANINTIIIADENKLKDSLNIEIRNRLLETKEIDTSKSIKFTAEKIKQLDKTNALFAESYEAGDILHFNKTTFSNNNEKIFNRGSKAVVKNIDVEKNILIVENQSKTYEIKLNHRNKLNFSIYQNRNIELAKNDEIVFLKNDKNLNIQNNTTAKIIDVKDNIITVKNEKDEIKQINIDKYKNIDYSYSLTNYKSQGATLKETLYAASLKNDEQRLYVAMSRATDKSSIFATKNEKEALFNFLSSKRKESEAKNKFNEKLNTNEKTYKSEKRNLNKFRTGKIFEKKEKNLNQNKIENKRTLRNIFNSKRISNTFKNISKATHSINRGIQNQIKSIERYIQMHD